MSHTRERIVGSDYSADNKKGRCYETEVAHITAARKP